MAACGEGEFKQAPGTETHLESFKSLSSKFFIRAHIKVQRFDLTSKLCCVWLFASMGSLCGQEIWHLWSSILDKLSFCMLHVMAYRPVSPDLICQWSKKLGLCCCLDYLHSAFLTCLVFLRNLQVIRPFWQWSWKILAVWIKMTGCSVTVLKSWKVR